MKAMLLFLLAVRMLFLLGAAGLCIWGFLAAGEPGAAQTPWLWKVGYAVGLIVTSVLIGFVWKSAKAVLGK